MTRFARALSPILEQIAARRSLPPEVISRTQQFLAEYDRVLEDQKMALTYWDPHFDNFIVRGEKIVGMLDFERTDIMSIDYVLDIVQRMVRRPEKYASEESEQFTKAADYSSLLDWYQEFYPELFDFEDLERRLDIYSISYSLSEIDWYPQAEAAKQELLSCIGHT